MATGAQCFCVGLGAQADYFKAVVLDVTLEENPLEIEKLETSFQMGEDEKLGYNPTEKYLKAKLLGKERKSKTFVEDSKLDKTGEI